MINIRQNLVEKKEINSSEFKNLLKDFISKLTSYSVDKELLDEQSVDQIVDMTYKYNSSLNATFFSNCLLPKDLYNKLKFTPWRLHSSQKASFLVDLHQNENNINIVGSLDLFFPQLFELRKKKNLVDFDVEDNFDDLEVKEEDNDVIEIDDSGDYDEGDELDEFSLHKEFDDSFTSQNENFGEDYINLKFESERPQSKEYLVEEIEIERNNEIYIVKEPITGPLNHLGIELDININIDDLMSNASKEIQNYIIITGNLSEQSEIIQDTKTHNLKLDSVKDEFLIKIKVNRINNEKIKDVIIKSDRIFQVSFIIKNLRLLGGKSRNIRRKSVFKKSLISPLIKLKLKNGNLIRYVQNLSDLLDIFHLTPEQKDQYYIKQKFIQTLSRQINCILTFIDREELYISPFGIFDQLKFAFKELEMDDTFDDLYKFQEKLFIDGQFDENEIIFLKSSNHLFGNISYISQIFLIFKSIKEYLKIFTEMGNPKLRFFQWDNSIWRIKFLIKKLTIRDQINEEFNKFNSKKISLEELKLNINKITKKFDSTARIIKAPTGSGKTLIFFIDTLLHYFFTKERCVIIFPTRLLNLEMFQNLTYLLYSLNFQLSKNIKDYQKVTTGLYIGKSQFNLRSFAKNFNRFSLIPVCPQCRSSLSFKINKDDIAECESCHHLLDYIYTPYKDQVNYFIPDILVATPDKIFWDLFIDKRVASRYGNFGTLVIKCPFCKKYTSFLNKEQNKAFTSKESTVRCMNSTCQHTISLDTSKVERRLIGFIILDEIHSVSGITGILLSKLIKSLKFLQIKYLSLKDSLGFDIEIETGTATIAEEELFINKLVEKNVSVFPPEDNKYYDYFQLQKNKVRYRVLVLNTMFSALRRVFSYLNIYNFQNYAINRIYSKQIIPEYGADTLNLGCGYVYRKLDGYTTKTSIFQFGKEIIKNPDALQNLTAQNLNFISGNSTQKEIISFLEKIKENEISIFLANQVVSLGLNIKDLNRIILFGTPKSMNEQVQTIGRIGRSKIPGMATILLYPNVPRDDYLYENFHFYFLNCNRLFEPNPIQNFNLFITEILTPNLFLLYINSELEKNYLLKLKNYSRQYWHTVENVNKKDVTNFIKTILFGSGNEFGKPAKIELIKKVRRVLMEIEEAIMAAGSNEFLSQILERKNFCIKGLRKSSGQVGIRIQELNTNFIT